MPNIHIFSSTNVEFARQLIKINMAVSHVLYKEGMSSEISKLCFAYNQWYHAIASPVNALIEIMYY